jgi:cytochrome c oxidase subunit 3
MSQATHTHHDGPVEYKDEQFGKASPGKIGMWLFLGTDALSFSGFLIAYAVLRATHEWPEPSKAGG